MLGESLMDIKFIIYWSRGVVPYMAEEECSEGAGPFLIVRIVHYVNKARNNSWIGGTGMRQLEDWTMWSIGKYFLISLKELDHSWGSILGTV